MTITNQNSKFFFLWNLANLIDEDQKLEQDFVQKFTFLGSHEKKLVGLYFINVFPLICADFDASGSTNFKQLSFASICALPFFNYIFCIFYPQGALILTYILKELGDPL